MSVLKCPDLETYSVTVGQMISGQSEQWMRETRSEAFDCGLGMVICVEVEI